MRRLTGRRLCRMFRAGEFSQESNFARLGVEVSPGAIRDTCRKIPGKEFVSTYRLNQLTISSQSSRTLFTDLLERFDVLSHLFRANKRKISPLPLENHI